MPRVPGQQALNRHPIVNDAVPNFYVADVIEPRRYTLRPFAAFLSVRISRLVLSALP